MASPLAKRPRAGLIPRPVSFGPWQVPKGLWKDERCFILGGSPWLKMFHVEQLRGQGRVIAINDAFRLAPWADMAYWADRNWLEWNCEAMATTWGGGLQVTRSEPHAAVRDCPIKQVRHDRNAALSRDPGAVAGWCSGSNAINIAWLAGASPIVLLGFAGANTGNWHANHKTVTQAMTYPSYIVPSFERMAVELQKESARVVNATPDTALTCFPKVDIEGLLRA